MFLPGCGTIKPKGGIFVSQTREIRRLLTEAYYFAKQSFELCYDDINIGKSADTTMALSFAAKCTSKYADAAAVYLSNPELEDENILLMLRQFEVFTAEIRTAQKKTKRNNTNMHIEFEHLENLLRENGYQI